MPRLTKEQFDTLFRLQDGHSCRCVGGNPCHSALYRKGFITIKFVSRRDYLIRITPTGLDAVTEALTRKTRQKSTLVA
jgi:hypothetical protein